MYTLILFLKIILINILIWIIGDLANYHALKYILKNNKENKLLIIGFIGTGDLYLSKSFLSDQEKEKNFNYR